MVHLMVGVGSPMASQNKIMVSPTGDRTFSGRTVILGGTGSMNLISNSSPATCTNLEMTLHELRLTAFAAVEKPNRAIGEKA